MTSGETVEVIARLVAQTVRVRDGWRAHNERCGGDVLSRMEGDAWVLTCIGVETSALMECGWEMRFEL